MGTGADPDIFFEIYKNDVLIYTSTIFYQAKLSDLPFYWAIQGVYFQLNDSFRLRLYDKDNEEREIMLNAAPFFVNNDFPTMYSSIEYYWGDNKEWIISFDYKWY